MSSWVAPSKSSHTKSPWRLTWPFLLLVPLLLSIVTLGAMVQGVGHIVVENGVRWERAQRDAVMHLVRHSDSCDAADYQRYQAAMQVLQAFETARVALFKDNGPDTARAMAGYKQAGVNSWDAALLVRVLPLLQSTAMQMRASALWQDANALARELDDRARSLHARMENGCLDPGMHRDAMAAVLAIDQRISLLRDQFAELSSNARWRLTELVLAGMLLLAVPLTVAGYLLSARLQRGATLATEALAVSEQRLDRALTGSGYGLWDMDVATRKIYCSAGMMQILGLGESEQEFTHQDFATLLHPDEGQTFELLVDCRAADGQRLDIEVRLRTGDGSFRWFRLAGQTARLVRGQPRRLLGSIFDVNDRRLLQQAVGMELEGRRAALSALSGTLAAMVGHSDTPIDIDLAQGESDIEAVTQAVARLGAQLRATNSKLEAILELSPEGFVSFDENHRVGFVSPQFTALTGLAAAELLGAEEADFFARLGAVCHQQVELRNLDSLRRSSSEDPVAMEIATDPPRALKVQLRSGQHETVRDVLCLRDVTREQEVERLKSEFLTLAAHELRTPMTSIFGYVELMLHRTMKGNSAVEVQRVIHRQSQLMISILDDLMDLSRLEARRGLALQMSEIDLAPLLKVTAQSIAVPEGREPPMLASSTNWPPAKIAGDPQRLTRAFLNLLSNAYKYSPAGGPVQVDVRRSPGTGGFDEVCVSVIDHGFGMSPAQLAHVGERFYRADTSGHIPGTGLGVSIVNEIIKLHGGRIAIASNLGEGTRVDVFLPALPSTQAAVPAQTPAEAQEVAAH